MNTRGFLRRAHAGGFRDRHEAGRALGRALAGYRTQSGLVVIGLARGGVPVAAEVAAVLGATTDVTLDVLVVRKLGMPGHQELALGAITRDQLVLNDRLVANLGVAQHDIEAILERERRELQRRENTYRLGRPPPDVTGRTVILVDDGVATGATMRVAALSVRAAGAAKVVVAVPTGPDSIFGMFGDAADDVVCVYTPQPFVAVGLSYRDFDQVTDEEVTAALTAR
ncbi:phosphoribosyltransferase [Mycolicibacterium mengxianglii]|uniref:phosphoribosyltransferase n=1 Tax=Mycolicibacterium mengxianglii TaxID=2736649 RepID=UPI0018EF0263|nr:phosphoribosyltransferase family protein [Mycolicibacterium mengxianglii]